MNEAYIEWDLKDEVILSDAKEFLDYWYSDDENERKSVEAWILDATNRGYYVFEKTSCGIITYNEIIDENGQETDEYDVMEYVNSTVSNQERNRSVLIEALSEGV